VRDDGACALRCARRANVSTVPSAYTTAEEWVDDTGLMGPGEHLHCEPLLSYRTSRAPSVPHSIIMKAMAILVVTASLVAAVEAVEAVGVVLSAQALGNRKVARATGHWREENTAEVLVVAVWHSHATDCPRGDFADAHFLLRVDVRSNVVDSQSYYSYRFP
jgi:hypothetical protein